MTQKITVNISANGFSGMTNENIEKALSYYFGGAAMGVSFSVKEVTQKTKSPKHNLILEEIKWCEEHRNPAEETYQDGFIAGLQHALFLMKSH